MKLYVIILSLYVAVYSYKYIIYIMCIYVHCVCYTNMANSPKIGLIPRPDPCNSIQRIRIFLAL